MGQYIINTLILLGIIIIYNLIKGNDTGTIKSAVLVVLVLAGLGLILNSITSTCGRYPHYYKCKRIITKW